MGEILDLLARPTYGLAQADRLLGLKSGTASRWIDGYERNGRHYEPLVRESSTGQPDVTWGEFIEARLLAEYRTAGVPIFRMRPAVMYLRQEFGPYPLASARMWLGDDGRDLVLRAQEATGLDRAQWIVVPRLAQEILPGLDQGIRWSDRAERFRHSLIWSDDRDSDPVVMQMQPQFDNPDIVIDPLRGFGEPVVRNVPTEVVAELIRAGDDPEMIAELYELTVHQVNAAVRFELSRHAS